MSNAALESLARYTDGRSEAVLLAHGLPSAHARKGRWATTGHGVVAETGVVGDAAIMAMQSAAFLGMLALTTATLAESPLTDQQIAAPLVKASRDAYCQTGQVRLETCRYRPSDSDPH
jgi:uncharacterized membrane protein YhiD involved in acid resistance